MDESRVNGPQDENEVFAAFEEAFEHAPDRAEVLREWQRRFPQHADLLTSAAVMLSLSDTVEEETPEEAARSKAIWDKAIAEHRAAYEPARPPAAPLTDLKNALAEQGLNFQIAAKELRVKTSILSGLQQRMISLADAPIRFLDDLADLLGRTRREVVAAFSTGGPRLAADAQYRAAQAPSVAPDGRQSFAEALQTSGMSDEDIAYWMAEIRAGRTQGTDV